MANKENKVVEKEVKVIEPEVRVKEAIDTLRVQLVEHKKQAEYHATMATKAQGALEVLLQLYPEEDSGEES